MGKRRSRVFGSFLTRFGPSWGQGQGWVGSTPVPLYHPNDAIREQPTSLTILTKI